MKWCISATAIAILKNADFVTEVNKQIGKAEKNLPVELGGEFNEKLLIHFPCN